LFPELRSFVTETLFFFLINGIGKAFASFQKKKKISSRRINTIMQNEGPFVIKLDDIPRVAAAIYSDCHKQIHKSRVII
jgi:hypothetical protein